MAMKEENRGKDVEIQTASFEDTILLVKTPVYLPREDSFLVAQAVRKLAYGEVLDMGTGSGIQAITAAKKKEVKYVTAVDANEKALQCAEENAAKNKVEKKIKFIQSNLFENIEGKFNTIIFNPPYLPVEKNEKLDEQTMAWHGGSNGRKVLDPFLDQFASFLSPGGQLLLLQSSLNALEKTVKELKKLGFSTEVIVTQAFFFEKIYVLRAVSDKSG